MTQIFAAPGRYIQGYKELDRLHRHVAWFGRRLLVITTQGRFDSLKQTLSVSFESTRTELHFGIFTGEVTRQEIQRLTAHMHGLDCDGVIGIGGGK
ncbi:iron-containing alcohol dehydrogenase, partial [Pseudomonas umsongensis]